MYAIEIGGAPHFLVPLEARRDILVWEGTGYRSVASTYIMCYRLVELGLRPHHGSTASSHVV
jgi:hypothetical protein